MSLGRAGSLGRMQPAVPEEPDSEGASGQAWMSADDVGAFSQGTAFSRWALARYLVGRAIAASVSDTLMVVAVGLLVIAAAVQFGLHVTWLAVIVVILALGVLMLRWVVRALLARFTDATRYRPVEAKLRQLVDDTHSDVMAELKRIGLPCHTLTLPLLAVRLAGRRRRDTMTRLRQFQTERAVPPARLDELHMLLRTGEAGIGGAAG